MKSPHTSSLAPLKPRTAVALCLTLIFGHQLHAAPAGHLKIALGGDFSEGGEEIYSPLGPTLLSDGATAFFFDYPNFYAGDTGGIRETLAEDMSAPGGRIFSDVDYAFDGPAMNSNGDMAFLAYTTLPSGSSEKLALYLKNTSGIYILANDGASAPGGGVFDFSYQTPKINNKGTMVSFVSSTTGGSGMGIYLATLSKGSASVKRVAGIGSPSPNGSVFTDFDEDNYAVNNSGTLVFEADTQDGRFLFYWDGSSLGVVPQSEDPLSLMLNDSDQVAFSVGSWFVESTINFGSLTEVNAIVSTDTEAPGGGFFQTSGGLFGSPVLTPGGKVAFSCPLSDSSSGIFLWSEAGMQAIARTSDPVPGGGLWNSLDSYDQQVVPTDTGKVYFKGDTSGGQQIFAGDGTNLWKVIGPGSSLVGQTVESVDLEINGHWQMAGQGPVNGKGQIIYQAQVTNGDRNTYGLFLYPYQPAPEIALQQPIGTDLKDGKSKKSFGSVQVGKTGPPKTFTIKNTGTKTLSGISVILGGPNASEFAISGSSAKQVPPGKTMTFQVAFKPKTTGTRGASLHIKSNDKDENPFDITLTGAGVKKK